VSSPSLLDEVDWAQTPLGPREDWPERLVDLVHLITPARMPMMIWWGPDLVQVYNEAYALLSGTKHPGGLGQRAEVAWAEVWDDLGPLAKRVMTEAEPSFAEGRLLLIERHHYVEETYWTSSYSPITDGDSNVLGVLVASTDVTANVVGARRLETVRQLGTLSSSTTVGLEQTCKAAVAVLAANRQAIPFATMHVIEGGRARLAAGYGVGPGGALNPAEEFDLTDAPELANVVASQSRVLVTGLRERYGSGLSRLNPGPLGDAVPDAAMLLPVSVPGASGPVAVATLGVNPYRAVDDVYLAFFQLVARQLRVAVGDAVAYDQERQRAKELAEIDEDKTRFYQNVSHELRTPVTLVLGPLRSVLADPASLPFQHRQDLRSALRAAMRLRKLVDNMFQFSRAERDLEAYLEPVDLAALTTELAAMFRPVAVNAGLTLRLDVSLVTEAVETDREMWSEIVLNLMSNAIKFTQEGEIEVVLRPEFDRVVLEVRDTGVGIPQDQLTQVFERFAQVPGQSGRSAEGAGIGLALVRALAAALGGEASVESEVGKGSTFRVWIPAQAPSETPALVPAPARLERWSPAPYVSEAESWVGAEAQSSDGAPAVSLGRLLLVEDNLDMRGYLRRLLTDDGWTVIDVPTVDLALAVSPPPDIVVSDIMLPGRSGLDLVRLIRSDELTRRTPVILLTARYGSDAASEGLAAGADDYVVKPFDPTELLARIRTHFELFQLREFALSQAEERASNLQKALASNRQIGVAMGVLMARQNLTEEQAFAVLREASQRGNRKLRDIADEVVLTGQL